ncbi:ectonucleotide pyrophosphatase/phosphodiesterase [Rufibacter ruber]|uniref:alkaline phosphatase family protein n=1 Tax=Rufibacter ruber TaxID=1783499 RepID=UPI000835E3C6|nr:ectonucleotide pyrophosphatase/phosphodiesterase [Rufibacter ruber]
MKQLPLLICLLFSCLSWVQAQPDTTQQVVPNRVNSPAQQQKPYVILISADGFRHDYVRKYNCQNLRQLAQQGVQAKGLQPAFPSKTFPNHYSLVTGLYPAHHGLINNKFYDPNFKAFYANSKPQEVQDPKWYGGTPLWVLAERQQMLSASFYWPGSEAPIQSFLPTYHYRYSEKIAIDQRINTVVEWLQLPAERRPHLITFYFPEVDHAGHTYGPDSPETEAAVQFIDASIGKLTQAVAATGLPVNFVFTADHGMATVDQEQVLRAPPIDTAQFVVSGNDIMIELYAKQQNRAALKQTYKRLRKGSTPGYKVYLKQNMPKHLHYRPQDDSLRRIGDIILLAQWPKIFHSAASAPSPGHHGYDPSQTQDLNAAFIAWGPDVKQGLTLPVFENVHVFPIVAQILGLPYNFKLDGNRKIAQQILSAEPLP